jgi:hypothetical protein
MDISAYFATAGDRLSAYFAPLEPYVSHLHGLSLHHASAISPNTLLVLLSSAFAIIFHISILRILFDFLVWRLLGLYLAIYTVPIFTTSLFQATLIATSFNTTLLLSIGSHRIFFHRLRHFPGPFGASISRFWLLYQLHKRHDRFRLVESFHKRYGPIVRLGASAYSSRESLLTTAALQAPVSSP